MVRKWLNRKEDEIGMVNMNEKVRMYVNGDEFVVSLKFIKEVV